MRGGLVGALLVVALYGGSRLDVLGIELLSSNATPQDEGPLTSAFASRTSDELAVVLLSPTPTATPTPEATATPEPEPTETPQPEPEAVEEAEEAAAEPEPTETPEPTATPVPPTPTATPTWTPVPPTVTPSPMPTTALRRGTPLPGTITGTATPYWDGLAGLPLGCNGYGVYNPGDASIIAVGPARYSDFPCGTVLQVCGPAGCVIGVRMDSCPACPGNDIDLSRAAFNAVCGANLSRCSVTITRK